MFQFLHRESKASKFRLEFWGDEGAAACVSSASSGSTSIEPELCPEISELFRKEESSWNEELPENREVSELLCSGGASASDGNSLMNFVDRKRDNDLRFPEYQEPQPSVGSVPDKRLLAFRALEREDSM